MDFTLNLSGFKELADGLRQLPENVGKNYLRSAVGAGAAVVRNEARLNAQRIRVTGRLARSIYSKQIRELSDNTKQTYYVGARQGKKYQKVGKKGLSQDAYYARFVELGHFTRPSTGGKVLRKSGRGQINNARLAAQVQAGQVRWVPPHPFLRPAFDVKQQAAVDAMGAKLRARLESLRLGK